MNFGTVVAHYLLNSRFFNSNYSRIMLQSSGHRATERPFPKVSVVPSHFPKGIYIEVKMKSENNF